MPLEINLAMLVGQQAHETYLCNVDSHMLPYLVYLHGLWGEQTSPQACAVTDTVHRLNWILVYGLGFSSFFFFLSYHDGSANSMPMLYVIQEQGRNQTLCMSRAGWGMFISVASVLLFPDKAQPGLQGQMTVTRPRGLLEVDVDFHPGDSTQAVQESESCFSNRLGAEQPREPQVTEVFLLSGQFKTNRYTSNRLSQTQQEILCESQARRLPYPEHNFLGPSAYRGQGDRDCRLFRRGQGHR